MKNSEIVRRLSGGRLWIAVAAMSFGIILLIFAASGTGDQKQSGSTNDLESKLTRLCERVDGVSEVTIAVSLDGERLCGVGVVCVGGDDPRIRRELTELIAVACDLGSNKIFITGAEKSVSAS